MDSASIPAAATDPYVLGAYAIAAVLLVGLSWTSWRAYRRHRP